MSIGKQLPRGHHIIGGVLHAIYQFLGVTFNRTDGMWALELGIIYE